MHFVLYYIFICNIYYFVIYIKNRNKTLLIFYCAGLSLACQIKSVLTPLHMLILIQLRITIKGRGTSHIYRLRYLKHLILLLQVGIQRGQRALLHHRISNRRKKVCFFFFIYVYNITWHKIFVMPQ